MEYLFDTNLNGRIAITSQLENHKQLNSDKTLFKFIWVQSGSLNITIDHITTTLAANQLMTLTPIQHVEIIETQGCYTSLLFNSNFYCIYGHDNEVSCNGLLFYGASEPMVLTLTDRQSSELSGVIDEFMHQTTVNDDLQEEMLRLSLKKFIIITTRIARQKLNINSQNIRQFDIIRQYYILVDQFFREKKRVQDYADMLYRSPKTLSNIFASYAQPSPLRIIHERTLSEARRLLLYTDKSAKEIGSILGFDDPAAFSRFFKKVSGESLSEYRKVVKREELTTDTEQ